MSNNLENIKQVTPKCGFADKAGNIHKTKQDAYRVNLELELARLQKELKSYVEVLLNTGDIKYVKFFEGAISAIMRKHSDYYVYGNERVLEETLARIITNPKAPEIFKEIARLEKELEIIYSEILSITEERKIKPTEKKWYEIWK